MLERFRKYWALAMKPGATLLMRLGVKPDHVTWAGTVLVCAIALWLVPTGHLWQGALAITAVVLSDGLDGQLARMTNQVSKFGAFLDSSLDRVADGIIFGAVLLWLTRTHEDLLWPGVTLVALVMGQVTSYTKARAESVGFTCTGGIAARADRLFILLFGMLLAGFGVPWALEVAVALLALASTYTVGQRMAQVARQARAQETAGA